MSSIIRMAVADLGQPTYGPEPAGYTIEGSPVEKLHEYYDKDGTTSGVWECSPGTMREPQTTDEFCTILAGRVEIIDELAGTRESFSTGDSFFLPKGSTLTWVITETVRKFYATAG